jgi:hypothetical protein
MLPPAGSTCKHMARPHMLCWAGSARGFRCMYAILVLHDCYLLTTTLHDCYLLTTTLHDCYLLTTTLHDCYLLTTTYHPVACIAYARGAYKADAHGAAPWCCCAPLTPQPPAPLQVYNKEYIEYLAEQMEQGDAAALFQHAVSTTAAAAAASAAQPDGAAEGGQAEQQAQQQQLPPQQQPAALAAAAAAAGQPQGFQPVASMPYAGAAGYPAAGVMPHQGAPPAAGAPGYPGAAAPAGTAWLQPGELQGTAHCAFPQQLPVYNTASAFGI